MPHTVQPPSNDVTASNLAATLGAAGLYVYAFGALTSIAAANASLLLMLLGAALNWRSFWSTVRTVRVFWLLVAFVLYLLARTYAAGAEFPASAKAQKGALFDLLAASGPAILLGAYWLKQGVARIQRVQAIAVAGLLAHLVYTSTQGLLSESGSGRFAMAMSPNAAGLIAAVLTWGAALRLIECLATKTRQPLDWAVAASLVCLLGLGCLMLVLSGSKSAWIAALLVLPVGGILYARRRLLRAQRRTALGMLVLSLAIAGIAIATVGGGSVLERLSGALDASRQLIEEGAEETNDGSIAPRLLIWANSKEHILARPLTGWGPGSAAMLLDRSPDERLHAFSHYHNLPLMLLVTLGAIGTLLFYAIQAGLVASAWQALRACRGPPDTVWFALGGLAMFHIAHLFQYRLNNTPGQFLLSLLGMIALSGALRLREARETVTARH